MKPSSQEEARRGGLPLAAKFGLGTGVTLLLILACVMALQYANERGKIEQAIDTKGNDTARLLAVAAVQPILNYDFMTLETLLAEATSDPLIGYVQCKNGDGAVVAATEMVEGPHIRVFSAPITGTGENALGEVRVGIDTGPYRAKLVKDMQWIAGSIAVLGAALVITLLFLLDRIVLKPLRRLTAILQDMADGNLAIQIDAQGGDEVAHLLRTSRVMAQTIRDHVSGLARLSESLAEAAKAMGEITNETNARVHHQERDTEQVALSMHEMATTVQSVARSASETAAAAQRANEEARSGQHTVQETIDGIQVLAHDMDEATDVIRELREKSQTIGAVLDVIREIASQTNLLALNAAIEAARAGDQGRGFAVVADEVRTLANRTQQSAQEIQKMIESFQAGAERAVATMEQGSTQARHGAEGAQGAGTALRTITEKIDGMSDMTAQIASAAEEQSAVAEEVNRNVENIRQIAHQTTAGAERIADTGDLLRQLVADLETAIRKFRL